MAAELKTKPTNTSATQYFSTLEEPRRTEAGVISTLLEIVTGQPPVLWGTSIIGFGSYDYKYDSGRKGTWFRIGFSPRKPAITFYIIPGLAEFDEELAAIGPHKAEKSCLYIRNLTKTNMLALEALARKSWKLMAGEYPV